MATAMDVGMSTEDNKTPALSIGSFGRQTCTEVKGEEIRPQDAEGWTASGRRVKHITTGKYYGESTVVTRHHRPRDRASFAKRVATSVTKRARMPSTNAIVK